MTFDNPEVVEFGMAEELIQDHPCCVNSEGTTDMVRTKISVRIYVADAE